MDQAALSALIAPLELLIQEAGQLILGYYRAGYQVTTKADRSPLTEADIAAHRLLDEGLRALTPTIPILSEEGLITPFTERRGWPLLWCVDPLDGTKGFVQGNDQFCISIALIHQHRPILGMIGQPVSGDHYFAWQGGGAFRRQDGQLAAIHSRSCPARPRVAGNRHPGTRLRAYLKRLGDHEYLTLGSALKSCLVAEGSLDLHVRFGPTSEWDTAAAQILVEEAGGGLTDFQGRALRYNTSHSLTNPDFLVFGDSRTDWSRHLVE